jgi:uncharacterized protein DUF6600
MKLLKIFIAAVWALGVTLASAAYADPPSVVGRLNYISGPVSFAPAQADEEWVAATLNRPITTGDRLWTDNNAFAEMHVGSLAIRMAPQTSLDVLNLDDRALQLRVAQGDVNLRVRRIPSGRLIEIATPNGAVVVRQPGSYRISVDGDSSTVTVRAGGLAEVFTAGSSVLVRDGEEAAISRSRPELFAASQPDEFDRWAADRDRRHDRVASTRYVPVEMTGYEDLDQYGEWRTVAEYGNVWIPSSVPTGWAPYRYGHWVWISPWGWTWVDDQPWGFAPSHYGRWVWYDNYWAWAPGRLIERPVYSPALVAFIGGANFSVSIGPAVGWVPLGYREPYIPWYTASRTYVRNVNITHVSNVTNINTTNIRYVNRTAPTGVTVVSRDNFISARPVQQATINVPSRTLAAAPVTRGTPVSQPQRTSFVRQERGSRPPAQVIAREAVVVNKPPALAREAVRERGRASAPRIAASAERLPVRVIERRERVSLPVSQTPRAEARAARPAIQAPRADAPATQQRQPQAVQQQAPSAPQSRQQEQAREQQGERLREQKREAEQQQKAQAQQQADQIERDRKQRSGQQEQAREQQRTQQEQQRQQQQAAQEQRARAQQARQQEQRQRQEEQQQKAQQEQQRAQQAAQKAQQEQQRAQQERERGQKAAAQEQREQQSRQLERQRAQEQAQKAQQEQQRAQQAAQKAQQDQQRAQPEQQRAQREQQRAQQEQQRAQQEQQLQRQQQAAQQAQKAQQEQQRAQQEQQRAQQAAQKAQQEQQRALQQQQRAQQQAAQAQQRAQQQPRAEPQAAPQEAEKAKRDRARKDQSDKDKDKNKG